MPRFVKRHFAGSRQIGLHIRQRTNGIAVDIKAQIDLTADEKRELADILECKVNQLAESLAPYATAALTEVVSMILGQKVFTRGSDLLEHRLLLLIRHAFNGRIPDEQKVCDLFQTTTSGGRSLIRAVMSKYQYQLKASIRDTLKELIGSAELQDGGSSLTIAVHSLNLVDELNRELSDIDPSLPPVEKKRGSVSTYELQPSSYIKLCEQFGVTSKIAKQ